MKNLIRNSIAALAVASFALVANAVPITGAISIAGAATPLGGDFNTATGFATLGPASAISTSGNFTQVPLFANNITMFAFDYGTTGSPALTPPGGLVVWTTLNLGITTSFFLTGITVVDHNVFDQVGLIGAGIFSITGLDDTYGTFNLTANQAGTTFSFSASQSAQNRVPDSASTAILLALGLGCMGFGVRRLKAIKS